MPAFLAPLIMAGISAGAGALNNRKQKQTTTQRTRRILSPEQQQAQSLLTTRMKSMIENPTAGLEPFRNAAMSAVNRNFATAPAAMEARMAGRGFRGGQLAGGLRQIEMGRQAALSGVESDYGRLALDQQNRGLSLAQDLMSQILEQESTGEGVTPGNMLGGAVSNGVETAVLLTQLNKLLGKG